MHVVDDVLFDYDGLLHCTTEANAHAHQLWGTFARNLLQHVHTGQVGSMRDNIAGAIRVNIPLLSGNACANFCQEELSALILDRP